MACRLCASEHQKEFSSEINVHFPGREGLEEPTVLVFPTLVVCIDCGFTEFTIRETELHRLRTVIRQCVSVKERLDRTQSN